MPIQKDIVKASLFKQPVFGINPQMPPIPKMPLPVIVPKQKGKFW